LITLRSVIVMAVSPVAPAGTLRSAWLRAPAGRYAGRARDRGNSPIPGSACLTRGKRSMPALVKMRRQDDKALSDRSAINHSATLQNRHLTRKSPMRPRHNPIQLFPDDPYVSRHGHAVIDWALFPPRASIDGAAWILQAHVPDGT
jgi:hypothetical protein